MRHTVTFTNLKPEVGTVTSPYGYEQPPPHAKLEIETTKQLAAIRQITAAIEHLRKQEYECAITLAVAAEGLLPPTDEPHIFSAFKNI